MKIDQFHKIFIYDFHETIVNICIVILLLFSIIFERLVLFFCKLHIPTESSMCECILKRVYLFYKRQRRQTCSHTYLSLSIFLM